MKNVLLLLFALYAPLVSAQSRGPAQGQRPFFGPNSQTLQTIDGAKNPELIPELYRWSEFRRMVMQVDMANQQITANPARSGKVNSYFPYKETIESLLGSKLPEVAKLASKYDHDLRDLYEERQKALQDSPSGDPASGVRILERFGGAQADLAIEERFKQDVLKLLDEQEKAQVQDFVLKEAVKRIKWLKLPTSAKGD